MREQVLDEPESREAEQPEEDADDGREQSGDVRLLICRYVQIGELDADEDADDGDRTNRQVARRA